MKKVIGKPYVTHVEENSKPLVLERDGMVTWFVQMILNIVQCKTLLENLLNLKFQNGLDMNKKTIGFQDNHHNKMLGVFLGELVGIPHGRYYNE